MWTYIAHFTHKCLVHSFTNNSCISASFFFVPAAGPAWLCPAGLSSRWPSSGASELWRDSRGFLLETKKYFDLNQDKSGKIIYCHFMKNKKQHCEVTWGCASVWACVCTPRAILRTLMILMMVGFMGSAALSFSSSRVIPMMDRATMAMSSWFHLSTSVKKLFEYWLGSLTKKDFAGADARDAAGSHLSLKNLWMPKAMSLSRASTTKMQVNT